MLTNRELATLIWLGLVVAVFIAVPSLRRSVGPQVVTVVRLLLQWSLLRVFLLFIAWVTLLVWIAWRIGVWDPSLLKDTLILLVAIGFPLLFQSVRAKSGGEIVRRIRNETLTLSAFFLFYLNLESLPLWGELVLQPMLFLLVITVAFAQRDTKYRQVGGCLTVLLAIVGLGLVIWTTVFTIVNWEQIDGRQLAHQLGLSIWLPFAMFPFLYAFAFVAAIESNLKRLSWLNPGIPPAARCGIVVGLHFSVRWASALTGRYASVGEAKTFRAALHAMSGFRADVERREGREAQRLADLAGFSEIEGVDGDGAQLDRREFEGTKRALRFIHTAQALRFERLGNQFWDDLTNVVLRPVSKYGLPDDHGVVVETTADGRKWRGWRRLPSGWVLGVGATGRAGEYLYSGPDAPTSWPGAGGEWVDVGRSKWPPDWDRYDGTRL